MPDLDRLLPFEAQLTIWQADWAGTLVEFAAMVSEGSSYLDENSWDRTAASLANTFIFVNGEMITIPAWHALPWVTEYVMRHDLYAAVRDGIE